MGKMESFPLRHKWRPRMVGEGSGPWGIRAVGECRTSFGDKALQSLRCQAPSPAPTPGPAFQTLLNWRSPGPQSRR